MPVIPKHVVAAFKNSVWGFTSFGRDVYELLLDVGVIVSREEVANAVNNAKSWVLEALEDAVSHRDGEAANRILFKNSSKHAAFNPKEMVKDTEELIKTVKNLNKELESVQEKKINLGKK